MALTDKDRRMFEMFIAEFTFCWGCGWRPKGKRLTGLYDVWAAPMKLENHHIFGGARRKHVRNNIARLCSFCHRVFHGDRFTLAGVEVPPLTLENVLWLKQTHDPQWYDRQQMEQLADHAVNKEARPDEWFIKQYETRRVAYPCDADMGTSR